MGIFRGPGGTGDATGDATNQASIAIAAANTATSAATSASNSAIAAAASAASINPATLATLTGTETLTNKTLTNPTINGFTGNTDIINVGSGQLYKDASGKIGIGTTNPISNLDITGSSSSGITASTENLNTTTGAYTGYEAIGQLSGQVLSIGTERLAGPSAAHYVYGVGAYPLYFTTDSVERMRISSSGDIISATLYDNTSSGGRDVQIASNGTLYSVSSSLKYKKDIESLDYDLVDNAISNLRPVFYRDNEPKGDVKENWSHIGLIAEEAAEVEPRIVHYKTMEVTFEDEEVEEGQRPRQKRIERVLDEPVPEGIDYARLSILCLAEIQKQREVIASLTARIALLENNV
jgi:hypothetical protein